MRAVRPKARGTTARRGGTTHGANPPSLGSEQHSPSDGVTRTSNLEPDSYPRRPLEERVAEEGLFPQLKRLVVGKPIPSHLAHHERLTKLTGLAVLSSDALSSVASATEEIRRVLILAGA